MEFGIVSPFDFSSSEHVELHHAERDEYIAKSLSLIARVLMCQYHLSIERIRG